MQSITATHTLFELPAIVETCKHQIDAMVQMTTTAVVVALEGDLGAGKTAFVKELAKQYGVSDTVTSPTFVVMRRYETADAALTTLVHIDAYRIEDEEELSVLKIEEILNTPQTLVCIEWPEHMVQTLKAYPRFIVRLSTIDQDTREIEISYTAA